MSDQIKELQGSGMQMPSMAFPCPNGQLYTVKPGDTLFFIAKKNNITLQSLIDANPQLKDPNTIFPGQVICIPVAVSEISCPNGYIYRVVKGDTMFEIAKRYGLTLEALVRANPQIEDPNRIFPGQEICIPVAGPVNCPEGTIYTVQPGDTLYEIARRNNMSLSALIAANPQIANPNQIFPGQMICIPMPGIGMQPLPEMPPMMPPMMPPTPEPMPPLARPMPIPPMPMPAPCPGMMPGPAPLPKPMPCPPTGGGMTPMYPMPFYVQIPWEECPYRNRKKKKRHCKRCS